MLCPNNKQGFFLYNTNNLKILGLKQYANQILLSVNSGGKQMGVLKKISNTLNTGIGIKYF